MLLTLIMARSEQEESPGEAIRRNLAKFDIDLKQKLEHYSISDLYGRFISLILFISISLGIMSAFYFSKVTQIDFYIVAIAFTFLAAVIVSFPLVVYAIVPLYAESYLNKEAMKTLLSYQILDLLIGIGLAFILQSIFPLVGAVIVFTILAFIHPLVKDLYKGKEDINQMNKILNKVYLILSIIYTLASIILKFAGLF